MRSGRGAHGAGALVGVLAAFSVACAGDPVKPARMAGVGDDAIEAPAPGDSKATSKESAGASDEDANPADEQQASQGASPAVAARASADLDAELTPSVVAPDGTPLPQTRDRPHADSAGLRLRLELLVAAIAEDDPERAVPAFFPKVAYEQVKAIERPGRDWQYRLVRAFERNIHEYHEQLGKDAAGAKFAGLTLRERAVRWMAPGSEGNRVGYYRVTRAHLRLRLASGAERQLELTSLISWRGAWYVVHLHGFS